MNHTETMKAIVLATSVEESTCEEIVKAYEKYCENNITRTTSKYMEDIVDYISKATDVSEVETRNVMNALFEIVNDGLRNKIPFMKSKNY